ncbi:MAG: type II toxin-antitoxin system RelE/ParE family toxin [Sphingomonadaceae bacterium]|nr:type II toxin-antitoxin system RelE/ParE family toxin [Sphingomonadaceae bacterium]
MLEIVFRPKAEADLEAIADYTKAAWGDAQAKRYLLDIRNKIAATIHYPGMGSRVFGLPSVYRKIPCGHHRAIYRFTDTEFIVVRIVHERDDVLDEIEDFW